MSPVLGGAITSTALPPGWFNLKDYGAVGDNTHDDTTAIQNWVNAAKAYVSSSGPSGGATLLAPAPNLYKFTSTVDFSGLVNTRILAVGARAGVGYLASTTAFWPSVALSYQGGGSGTAINFAGCEGTVWDGLSVLSTGAAFTGVLLNHDSSGSFGNQLRNMRLVCYNGGGCTHLSLTGAIEFSGENIVFDKTGGSGATGTQVRWLDGSAGAGISKWSNASSLKSCTFAGDRAYSELNPTKQIGHFDCTYEPTASGAAAPIHVNALGTGGSYTSSSVVTWESCGWWDTTAGNPWFSSTVATKAWAINGGYFEVGSAPVFALQSHTGLRLAGIHAVRTGGTGATNLFNPSYTISGGSWDAGNVVESPLVDNHASVFV